MLRLQDWSVDLPITIVQISLPTADCPHGPGDVSACGVIETDVVLLDDTDREAWTAFGQPESGTAFLIGELNEIVEKGSLDDLPFLRSRAGALAENILRRYEGD